MTFAKEGYSSLAQAIRKDLAVTIAPLSKLALTGLLEQAESGIRITEEYIAIIRNDEASRLGSH